MCYDYFMIFKLTKEDFEQLDKLITVYDENCNENDYLNNEIIRRIPNLNEVNNIKIDCLDLNNYCNDIYYKNIHPVEIKDGSYLIKYQSYQPGECFLYDDIEVKTNKYYQVKNKVGYFTKPYKFLTIQKNNTTWMSVIPHEINTMNACSNIKNKTLYVFGLGLGYYPYINASKVNEIIIVEKDKKIIELFNKYIFPLFNDKQKYKIINDDAFNYVNKINEDDSIFVDLWHNPSDALMPYIKLTKVFKKHNDVHYWINKSILQYIRNLLITLIYEERYQVGVDYTKYKSDEDKVINKFHILLKDKIFNSFQEIMNLLTDEEITKLVINL